MPAPCTAPRGVRRVGWQLSSRPCGPGASTDGLEPGHVLVGSGLLGTRKPLGTWPGNSRWERGQPAHGPVNYGACSQKLQGPCHLATVPWELVVPQTGIPVTLFSSVSLFSS